jgi:hypothetical protein
MCSCAQLPDLVFGIGQLRLQRLDVELIAWSAD